MNWPLFWHQGGPLSSRAMDYLQGHFPDSRIVRSADADQNVNAELGQRGLLNCQIGRAKAFMLRKLIDPYFYGYADHLLLLDTDVLFFSCPTELINAATDRVSVNLYNRDRGFWYNITPEAARDRYKIELLPQINAGLSLVRRRVIDLPLVDRFLADPDMLAKPWLTEQTIQALLGSRYGMQYLPETYGLSTGPGLSTSDGRPLICKHYPGHPRPYLYQEGMPRVLQSGLLSGRKG